MIKLFEQFNEYYQIEKWLDYKRVYNYTINNDLTVDVDGNVAIIFTGGHIPIQFGTINGNFDIAYNQLTTLKGCPKVINGGFFCDGNHITSLEYGPETVTGGYHFSNSNLTSLETLSAKIGGDVYFNSNKLTTLKGCPKVINGDFNCAENQLTSLLEAPVEVQGNFYYYKNPLPKSILDLTDDIVIFLKNKEEYGIYNNDGSFNTGRFNIFLQDYNSGILS